MRRLVIVLVVIVVLVGGFVLQLLYAAGAFREIEPQFDGTCRQVAGVIGPEDITLHPRAPIAYVSAADRRAALDGRPPRGGLYAYYWKEEPPRLVHLTPGADEAFYPHGLSLLAREGEPDRLAVVNHARDRQTIELYVRSEDRLVHERTLSDPLLVSPNDVVLVDAARLYVTNDHGSASAGWKLVEDYLRLPWSNVLYYDGESFVEAAGSIRYANGINVSPDGRTLYVASVTDLALGVYDRDPDSGGLALRGRIELGTGPDNVELDLVGNLVVACHPKLLAFVSHASDPDALSPSQVLHVIDPGGRSPYVEELYMGDGEALSGSSVAALRGDRLLIGAVFEPHFLDRRRAGP